MSSSTKNGQAKAKPELFDDARAARLVVDTIANRMTPDKGDLGRLPLAWHGAIHLAIEDGEPGVERWLKGEEVRDAKAAAVYRAALDVARAEPDTIKMPTPPPAFSLDLIGTAEFFAADYPLKWLVDGIVIEGESAVVGGPSKALKTSVLIDFAISLASATPFLGRFPVPRAIRVALISGESGRRVIQANAKQVCIARKLPYEAAAGVLWGFRLPQLTNAEHLGTLRKAIEDNGLEAMCLDPLYLSLLAGASGIDASNMYQMGPLLNDVSATCLEAGATPFLCHHAIKRRENPFDPMELEDLAYSGIGQFARQWMLLSRRERYDAESGVHRLHFRYGGSAGHAGEMHLDINTGKVDTEFNGRRWEVSTSTPGEGRIDERERNEAEREKKCEEKKTRDEAEREQRIEDNATRCLDAIKSLGREKPPIPATKTAIRERAGLNSERAGLGIGRLIATKRAERYDATVNTGTGSRKAEALREWGITPQQEEAPQ